MTKRCAFFLLIFFVAVANVGADDAGSDADAQLRLTNAIQNLQAAYTAWQHSDEEYRELLTQDPVPDSEIREFAGFVARLKRQVIEGCEAVRKLGGDMSQHGVNCAKVENEPESETSEVSPIAERELTQEEKAALLKSRLEKLEANYDETLLKYQNKLKGTEVAISSNGDWAGNPDANSPGANGSETRGSEADGLDSGGLEGELEQGETAVGGAPERGTAAHSGSDAVRKAEPGAGPGVEKEGKMPHFDQKDIPDGRDDDVVARQLREAAEAETDPSLKEQLWNEYKKYKNSTR